MPHLSVHTRSIVITVRPTPHPAPHPAHCYHHRIATPLLMASRDAVPATALDSGEQWAVAEQTPWGLLEGCRCRGVGGTDHECTFSSRLGRSWAPRPGPSDASGRRGCNAFSHFPRQQRRRARGRGKRCASLFLAASALQGPLAKTESMRNANTHLAMEFRHPAPRQAREKAAKRQDFAALRHREST